PATPHRSSPAAPHRRRRLTPSRRRRPASEVDAAARRPASPSPPPPLESSIEGAHHLMEFLRACSSNAQAIGDVDAIAYQAFSVARSPATLRDWSPDQDARAVEAALRDRQLFVARDAARPWLWLFTPAAVDSPAAAPADLPDVDGYVLQRQHAGLTKAVELARPPLTARHPSAASYSYAALHAAQNKAAAAARPTPAGSQTNVPDQPPPLDCFAVYDMFTSSVIALVTLSLVKTCAVVSLNYRTFVSKPVDLASTALDAHVSFCWLTSIHVHWTSAGSLIVSTLTEKNKHIRSLADISSDADLRRLVGRVVRVAPNGMLGEVMSFDDPLQLLAEETAQRPRRKRARRSNLEQALEKWKNTVKQWLAWKGYSLPDLGATSAWVRLRITINTQPASPASFLVCSEQDVLWPRALCFYHEPSDEAPRALCFYHEPSDEAPTLPSSAHVSPHSDSLVRWFEGTDSAGYQDPYDVAQQWFMGKAEREKMADAQRKAKKADEDALRRKEDHPALFPSSPLNTRIGTYGELQPVSGVYPTPPDGVVPGAAVFTNDTSCGPGTASNVILPPGGTSPGTASNVILPPGGTNPAINLSAPPESAATETSQQPLTSPAAASGNHHFSTSANNDDLFGDDMDEDGYEEHVVGDDDFDFFDGPNDGDVEMPDAASTTDTKTEVPLAINKEKETEPPAIVKADDHEHVPDPLAALEKALATTTSQPPVQVPQKLKEEQASPAMDQDAANISNDSSSQVPDRHPPSVKAPTPPLSPTKIREALKASPQTGLTINIPQAQHQNRRGSAFGPLSFSRKMSVADAKYHDGRYGIHAHVEAADMSSTKPIPPKTLRDVPLLTKLRYAVAVAAAADLHKITPSIQGVNDDSESDSGSDSLGSDESDEDAEEGPSTNPAPFTAGSVASAKRKLPTDGNATPLSVTSFAESMGGDLLELQNLHLDDTSLLSFEPSSWDWSLIKLPPPLERPSAGARYSMPIFPHPAAQIPDTPTSQPDQSFDPPEDKPMSGPDLINIAQMVTEQVVSATLDILGEDAVTTPQHTNRSSAEMRWSVVIRSLFPKAVDCTLPSLAAVNDVFPEQTANPKGQQRVPARKPNEPPPVPGSQVYPINPPFLRVRRADTPWDLLPPAIAFWEPLGLAPVNGPKNVVAFCIYPYSDSLRPSLESFLLHMQLAYDGCKLGTHTRVETVSEYENGLVPCKMPTPAAPRAVYKALRDTCVQFGKVLAARHANIREQHEAQVDALIIYMINPFDDPSALWELCASFWILFQTYSQAPNLPGQPQKPDLVLQIIPIKDVASFDHPVITSSHTYVNLAREVYNRSPPSSKPEDKTPLPIASAPAFQLEEPIPRNVPFKLQSEPPQDLLRENSYMHLAYAISFDGTWLTAAWTDSSGKSQATSTYHLGTRPFNELAKEIWATTITILQARKVHWRVCVARAGVMDRDELETWVYLISCPTSLNLFITLLTVDTQPSYRFTPTTPTPSNQSNPNTPAATPGAGASPDPTVGLTPAATPSAADPPVDPTQDPDARLVDTTDETWGIILAHRLHNSNSTTQFSPALISGLLVKRGPSSSNTRSLGTPDAEPGPITVGVNILWIGAVGSTRAATSPFPPTPGGSEPPSQPAGSYLNAAAHPPAAASASQPPTPTHGPQQTSSLMWTPTPQTRATAENLLKEILQQFRGLGLLARLNGVRGSRHGTVPWHVSACVRGVEGVGRVTGGR
ncbi:Mediator of RNA polymerase II transcription subunit 13, partial [Stagonosporopsis vannaccii]